MPALLFSLTLFLSAALVMLAQPLAGKTVLPLAGGTPASWLSCLVTFQALLLAGYFYADRLGRLPPRRQFPIHALVLAGGAAWTVFAQPLADPAWVTDSALGPAPGLVAYLLARLVGLVFPLAATAPLLQRWFSRTAHRRAADPYFLYAASNAGSLLGLVAYPLAVERLLPLSEQASLLFGGFSRHGGGRRAGDALDPRGGWPRPPRPASKSPTARRRGGGSRCRPCRRVCWAG